MKKTKLTIDQLRETSLVVSNDILTQVAGGNVPIYYSYNSFGSFIVSFDGGQTWSESYEDMYYDEDIVEWDGGGGGTWGGAPGGSTGSTGAGAGDGSGTGTSPGGTGGDPNGSAGGTPGGDPNSSGGSTGGDPGGSPSGSTGGTPGGDPSGGGVGGYPGGSTGGDPNSGGGAGGYPGGTGGDPNSGGGAGGYPGGSPSGTGNPYEAGAALAVVGEEEVAFVFAGAIEAATGVAASIAELLAATLAAPETLIALGIVATLDLLASAYDPYDPTKWVATVGVPWNPIPTNQGGPNGQPPPGFKDLLGILLIEKGLMDLYNQFAPYFGWPPIIPPSNPPATPPATPPGITPGHGDQPVIAPYEGVIQQ